MDTKLPLSAASLARTLSQSQDCVKLLDLQGRVLWMNEGGLCTMEIDDLQDVVGARWSGLWPDSGQQNVERALAVARIDGVNRFSGQCPTAKGTSKWWDVAVHLMHDESGAPIGFLSTSRDVTEREEQRLALEVVVAEMHHRLKNSYAMVGSLIRGLVRGDPQLDGFARDFELRISALAKAQSLIGPNNAETALEHLLSILVEPFRSHSGLVMAVPMDRIALVNNRVADAVALCIGEFAVNSAKYGAIGNGGRIAISCTVDGSELRIAWAETSSAAVTAHSREGGQGLRIIHRILAANSGSLDLQWKPNGLDAIIAFRQGFRLP